jgi:hypothetical protein
MSETEIITQVVLNSPVLEELDAAFDAIATLEGQFLQCEDHDFAPFHTQVKHLLNHLTRYYGSEPSVKELEEEMSSHQDPFFAPCSIVAFHNSNLSDSPFFPSPNQTFHRPPLAICASSDVTWREYPLMMSLPFSYVDERPSLQQLIEFARSQREIGIATFCHPQPLTLCAVAISLRESEYLIGAAEIPTVIDDLGPLLSDPNVTKVVPNAARTCQDLHSFGAGDLVNVFCVATASFLRGSPASLEEMTFSFRQRLQERWRSPPSISAAAPCPTATRSCPVLSEVVASVEAAAAHDWRLPPFSLDQMNIARQEVHYLLYLYDSLRCYLERASMDCRAVFRISNQKAAMNWDQYRRVLTSPNALIVASIYRQPLPNPQLFQRLMRLRTRELSNAAVLWLALSVPQTPDELHAELTACAPQRQFSYRKRAAPLPDALLAGLIAALRDARPRGDPADPPPKTLQTIITQLGWLSRDDAEEGDQATADGALVTGISPRLMAKTGDAAAGGGNLKHLMNPDQPTSVSKQIDGIPQTEQAIYLLANDVRMRQKLQGKAKAKLPAGKDDVPPDDDPETLLRNLVSVGYIDDHEARKIRDRNNMARPGGQRRSRSEDKPNQTQKREGVGAQTHFGAKDRRKL